MKKNAIAAYQQNKLNGLQEASPIRLVTLMLEEAISCIDSAAIACDNADIARKAKSLSRAMALIDSGLFAVLDFEKGAEVAENLGKVYQMVLAKLLEANILSNSNLMRECSSLMGQVREGWRAAEALDQR